MTISLAASVPCILNVLMALQGVTQQLLEEELQMTAEEILQMSNTLLQRNLVDIFGGGESSQLVFKLKDADQALK